MTGEQKALDALASVGEEAFSRLNLTAGTGHLARHAGLTELSNRMLFLDRVEQAVVRCRRSSATLAALFLDLDGFKGVTDRFGHSAFPWSRPRPPRGARLVEAIPVMGAALDLTVVAEGVERPEQLDHLRRAGCTFGRD